MGADYERWLIEHAYCWSHQHQGLYATINGRVKSIDGKLE